MFSLTRLPLLLLMACGLGPEHSAPPEAPSIRENPILVSFDTTQNEYGFKVDGQAEHQVVGVLVDDQGRRDLQFRTPAYSITLATNGFFLPPAAATNGPFTVACFNELVGPVQPSTNAPDPRDGVPLKCDILRRGQRIATLDAPVTKPAGWLHKVVALPDKFRITWYESDGPLVLDATEGDGLYAATLDRNGFSEPRLVHEAFGPSMDGF